MIRVASPFAALTGFMLLSGCLVPNPGVGPDGELPVIARPYDQGYDLVPLMHENLPAVAYDPDGCQVWILDDGAEGYSGRRRDPSSGLPICNGVYPPGSVVRDHQTNGIRDWVPIPPYGPATGVLTGN